MPTVPGEGQPDDHPGQSHAAGHRADDLAAPAAAAGVEPSRAPELADDDPQTFEATDVRDFDLYHVPDPRGSDIT
jgi:hypothetical protein